MRFFLYLIAMCFIVCSANAKSLADTSMNDFCDAPAVFSTSVCPGETVTRYIQNPDPAYTYNWYADAAHTILSGTGTFFTTPGLYVTTHYYVVAVLGNCSAEKMITITVIPFVLPIMQDDTSCNFSNPDICYPAVQNPQPGYVYHWYTFPPGATLIYTGTTYITPYLLQNTTYWVQASSGGCVSTYMPVHAVIGEIGRPSSNDTTICGGSSAFLEVAEPYNGYVYKWYNAQEGGTLLHTGVFFTTPALNSTKTYYVKSTRLDCYSISVPVVVTVQNMLPPTANASNITICPNTSAQLSVENPLAGTTYTWYADSQGANLLGTGINYTTAPVSIETTFYVAANDGTCPMNSALTPVAIHFPMLDSPVVTVTHADFHTITFSWLPVTDAIGYEVSVNGGPYISPGSGSMGLTHTVRGLSNTQSVTLTVKAIPPAQLCSTSSPGNATGSTYGIGFYVPSAFTPNGDSRNDILKPIIPFGSVLEYFTIYDRWGKLVFTTNKNTVGWNGKLGGRDQPMGTYVWICKYLFAGRTEIEQKGSFILLY